MSTLAAETAPGGTLGGIALIITAVGGMYATWIAARRSNPKPELPPPPPAHTEHSDSEAVQTLWFEMLSRLSESNEERDAARSEALQWRQRFEDADRERLELLRRLAGGGVGA